MLWRCVFAALGAAFCIVAAPGGVEPVLALHYRPGGGGCFCSRSSAVIQERLHVRRGVAAAFWIALAAAAACLLLYWIASFVVVQLAVASPGVAASVTELLRTATNRLLDMAQTLPDTLGGPIRSSLNSAYQTLTDGGGAICREHAKRRDRLRGKPAVCVCIRKFSALGHYLYYKPLRKLAAPVERLAGRRKRAWHTAAQAIRRRGLRATFACSFCLPCLRC